MTTSSDVGQPQPYYRYQLKIIKTSFLKLKVSIMDNSRLFDGTPRFHGVWIKIDSVITTGVGLGLKNKNVWFHVTTL